MEEAKTYAANAKTSETNTQTLKADVEALKTSINTEAENKKAEKAEKATSYNPDEHYTKTEVDEKIKTAIAAIADYDSTAF